MPDYSIRITPQMLIGIFIVQFLVIVICFLIVSVHKILTKPREAKIRTESQYVQFGKDLGRVVIEQSIMISTLKAYLTAMITEGPIQEAKWLTEYYRWELETANKLPSIQRIGTFLIDQVKGNLPYVNFVYHGNPAADNE